MNLLFAAPRRLDWSASLVGATMLAVAIAAGTPAAAFDCPLAHAVTDGSAIKETPGDKEKEGPTEPLRAAGRSPSNTMTCRHGAKDAPGREVTQLADSRAQVSTTEGAPSLLYGPFTAGFVSGLVETACTVQSA